MHNIGCTLKIINILSLLSFPLSQKPNPTRRSQAACLNTSLQQPTSLLARNSITYSSYAREEKLDKIVTIDDYNSINKKLSGCTRL